MPILGFAISLNFITLVKLTLCKEIIQWSIFISDLHMTESNNLLQVVLSSLDDDKAQDIISIPLSGSLLSLTSW